MRLFIKQGGLKRDVKDLNSFDDCFVRAQYEAEQMSLATDEVNQAREQLQSLTRGKSPAEQEQNKAMIEASKKKVDEKEKKRQKSLDDLLQALVHGLNTTEANGKTPPFEVGTAKAMLTYFYVDTKKYREAIDLGRVFAEQNPQAAQASLTAAYVLDAYVRLLIEQQSGANAKPEEVEQRRKDVFEWAKLIEQRWPQDAAADVARDQLAHRAEPKESARGYRSDDPHRRELSRVWPRAISDL